MTSGFVPPLLVSASRRCDIPAHYSRWFLERLDQGYCRVRNPFDASRFRVVPLIAGKTACIVFWTRDPAALADIAGRITASGMPFIAHVTLNGHPSALEPGVPDIESSIAGFGRLAERIGPERVLWRRDPILVAGEIDAEAVIRGFDRLSRKLEGMTRRVVVSLVDEYAGIRSRLGLAGFGSVLFGSLRTRGAKDAKQERVGEIGELPPEPYPRILREVAAMARIRGMDCVACAEPWDLVGLGVGKSSCIDPAFLSSALGISSLSIPPDRYQRPYCGCAASVDIGAYGSCPAGCLYCYASRGRGRLLALEPGVDFL